MFPVFCAKFLLDHRLLDIWNEPNMSTSKSYGEPSYLGVVAI